MVFQRRGLRKRMFREGARGLSGKGTMGEECQEKGAGEEVVREGGAGGERCQRLWERFCQEKGDLGEGCHGRGWSRMSCEWGWGGGGRGLSGKLSWG
jgi:hypothetical protein